MIKVILKGGLGNQMFQYAAAKSLAIETNTDIYIDLSFMKNRIPIKDFTFREYELEEFFNINEQSGTLLKNDFLDKYFSYPLELIYNKYLNKNYYAEGTNPYSFDSNFFDLKDGTTIEGYFNNPKYFEKHEEVIKEIFDTRKLYDKNFQQIEDKIKSSNSISINIRRGDYLNTKHKDVFVFLDENYYKTAIRKIRDKIDNPHFFVFSYDDPEWFANTFQMNQSEYTMMNKEYVGDKFKSYLRLISLCKHNIISNSTFAWWGAYLNKNSKKTVISPKRWMKDYSFNTPKSWIEIEN